MYIPETFFALPEILYAQVLTLCAYSPSELEMRVMGRMSWLILRHLLLPLFYAWLVRAPQAKVTVHIPNSAVARDATAKADETNLDPLNKEILSHLQNHPNGLSARQILQAMVVFHPTLELFDINGRLYTLNQNNLVSSLDGVGRAPLWIA